MHHIIAFSKFTEIDVERGTRGRGVRRFHAARTLHFVAAKNFRIGHDDQLCGFVKKTAAQRSDKRLRLLLSLKSIFAPNFSKPLFLTVIIAENLDRKSLSQPPMKLAEKF